MGEPQRPGETQGPSGTRGTGENRRPGDAQRTDEAQRPGETQRTEARPTPPRAPAEQVPTGWVGWVVFAGLMLVLLGAFHIIAGLTAVFANNMFFIQEGGLLVVRDYGTWGWVHFGIGVVAFATGLGVMAGQLWARVIGIIFAVLSAIVAIGFIAAHPLWAVILIVLDIIVIYALAVHGREMQYSG